MSEQPTPHQLIASEEYWDNLADLPRVSPGFDMVDLYSGGPLFAQYGASKVQNLYARSVGNGYKVDQIAVGSTLPLVERGAGLMRIVEDIRISPSFKSGLYKVWAKSVDQGSAEKFDNLAERMIFDPTYRGEPARMSFRADGAEFDTRILRVVSYLTGSKSGRQLEGIHSDFISKKSTESCFNIVIPPVEVGQAYRVNRVGRTLSKIVAAEVLIPSKGGKRVRIPKRIVTGPKLGIAFQ